MDSHYINEPKRTSEQLITARDAWLNKYQKNKVPELFKNQSNITPTGVNSGRPLDAPSLGIGATLGRTVADVGSTFIPARERKDPNQRINNQQRPPPLRTQVANSNFDDNQPPPPSGTALTSYQPNQEAENIMNQVDDFAQPETNVNTPYNLRESTRNQEPGFYTRQLVAGPFDTPNQRVETVDYSVGEPIVPFDNDMSRQERIDASNFENLMTSYQTSNSLIKLEDELKAISGIEEKYSDATSIHKKAIAGENYKQDLTNFNKKYGTSDTQSVIRDAQMEYKNLMSSIGSVHTEQIDRLNEAATGSTDVSSLLENEVRNSQDIEKDYYIANKNLEAVTEIVPAMTDVKTSPDGVGNTQIPPDPKANLETIAQQMGVGQMSSNFYSNFDGLMGSIREAASQDGSEGAQETADALVKFATFLKDNKGALPSDAEKEKLMKERDELLKKNSNLEKEILYERYKEPFYKRSIEYKALQAADVVLGPIENALEYGLFHIQDAVHVLVYPGYLMANKLLSWIPLMGSMALSLKDVSINAASRFVNYSSKAYEGWNGGLSRQQKFMNPKTEDEIINEEEFNAKVGETGQNPLQGLPNIKQMKQNGIGAQSDINLQVMGSDIAKVISYGNTVMNHMAQSKDPAEIEGLTQKLERINQYLEGAFNKLQPENAVTPQNIFGNFSIMTTFPGSAMAQRALQDMKTNPVQYTEALNSEISNVDSRLSSELNNRPEYKVAVRDVLQELKQKTMKGQKAVGYLKGSTNEGQYEWNIGAYRYLISAAVLVAALGGAHTLMTQQSTLAPALINTKNIYAEIINSYSLLVKTMPLVTPLVAAQGDSTNAETINIMKNWLSNLQDRLAKDFPGYKIKADEIDFNLKHPGQSNPSLIADRYTPPVKKRPMIGGTISYGIKDVDDIYEAYQTSMKRLKGRGIDTISETSGALKEIVKKLREWKPKFMSVKSLDKVLDVLKRLPEFKQGGLMRGEGVKCNVCKSSKRNFKVHKKNKDDITCSDCYNENGMTGGRITERDAEIMDIDDSDEPEHIEKTKSLKTNEYLDELERVKPLTRMEEFDQSANIDKQFVTRMSSDFVINRPYNQNPLRQKKDQDRLAYLLGMYEHSPETMTSAQKINMEALGINHLNMKGDPEASFPNSNKFNTHSGILEELDSNPGFLKRILQE
jgi:hypothetical protein